MLKKTVVTVLIFTVCFAVSVPVYAQLPDFPRTVIDMTGRPVTITTRPAVIGVLGSDPVAGWMFPAAELRLIVPLVESLSDPMNVKWSEIGLLIASEYYEAAYPAIIAAAEAAKVPVFRTTVITSLALWRESVIAVGGAAGREDHASDLMLHLDERQAAIRDAVGDQEPVRVLVLTPEGYTFGQGAWITDLIGAAGGVNVAAEAGFADYRQVADSTIRDLAPDVILLAPAWDRAAFMQIEAYADLAAVYHERVYRLPFSLTLARDPGAAMWVLAWVLHPRAMWEYNCAARVDAPS